MRFTFFAVLGLTTACSGGSMGLGDAGPADAGRDAGASDAGRADAGQSDAGRDAGPPAYTGCTCGDAGVCGTDALGDPLRCCNYQQDSCLGAPDAGPCAAPQRCSPRPPCCFDGSCFSSVSCRGTGTCTSWLGAAAPLDGTPCDDGRACSSAAPAPEPIDCSGTDAGAEGDDCRFDYSAAFPSSAGCGPAAPSCSGRGSSYGGNGGALQGGRCCPAGMACDFRAGATFGRCLGNLGHGLTSNDVCRAGVCAADDAGSCP